MSSQPPLIVPVQVDAFLVNDRVRAIEPPGRWYADFEQLEDRQPPEPDPFDDAPGKPGLGVHVQWLLPDALRRGFQDGPAAKVEFPVVPNRWLVVRYSRPADRPEETPAAAGWVVDSDFLDELDGTSAFLDPDPAADRPRPTLIGRAHDLADAPWTEPEGRRKFLTAIGPGLPTFATYQPYNENVFSFHDRLTDLTGPALLGYAVIGWYSDPSWDILHAPPEGDVRALLDSLRWSTTGTSAAPTRSFYAGTALGLHWDRAGAPPLSAKPDIEVDKIDVAVGHIVTDAETALHPAALDDPEASLLWEAFTYDLLDALDDGGETALDQATRRTWFDAEHGGYSWRIVDRPAVGTAWPARTPEQADEERQWLAELNQVQEEHDAASRELAHLQRRLYGLWWLRGGSNRRPDGWDAACDAELDPRQEGTLARRVQQQLDTVFGTNGLRSRIPWGDTAGELAEAVQAYAEERGLAPGRELQRCADPAFHSTPDPSLIVRGARLDRPLTDEDALPCRAPGETVTGIRIGDGTVRPPEALPAPPLPQLPESGVLTALLGEFFLLDRAAVTPGAAPGTTALEEALAHQDTHVEGTVARWTRPWEQPWSPLLLIWRTTCYPTPYRSGDEENWYFDGTRYRWKGENVAPDGLVGGRALLTPLPPFNTRARLAQHARTYRGGPVAELRELRDRAEEWDELSQRMEGVNNWLAQHTPATGIAPASDDALARLVDNSRTRVPLSEVPDPGPASGSGTPREFRPVRAGQIVFEELRVIDRFGRSLAVINENNKESVKPYRADSVTPRKTVSPQNPYRYVELPPRLLQPARLRFDFVSAGDDHHRVDVDAGPREAAGESPVCGWLIANHLSGSLLVHAPDGGGLGEIRIVLDTAHRPVSTWYPLPGSAYPDPDPATDSGRAFAAALPHLHGFVTGLLHGGAPAFAQLLSVVDKAMSATVPGGDDDSLAALVGRPMALLRSRLRFELNGPAMTPSSWENVLSPPEVPEVSGYLWNVRLGAGDMLGDGLAGFFRGSDYTRLHAVPEPGAADVEYVSPIDGSEIALPARPAAAPSPEARARDEETAAWVTLLADPWAAVHAVTDILPVSRLLLPPTWVREPLSRMKLSFRTGPLLAGTRLVTDQQGSTPTEHMVMPGPTGRRGTWTWAEPAPAEPAAPAGGPGTWTVRPLTTPDAALALSDAAPAARTGFLQLSGALGETDESRQRPPAQGPAPTHGSTS
ncbi:hypothetical protein SMD11_6857 [Streptomyces albireticuli]|uniref:Uncharacterized protein n=1 Tax=Streptomyces albireticuli TaxID=1940 RepID=A0A1Z2LDP8_9ACTN|nr:hypothetical protein [Streptomyces albireticuli]ARZ72433.1 hypothetical protein SMD11_6857 [Streptomyces albireticuli]